MTRGVLFDVGYCLFDEGPRLQASLTALAAALARRGRTLAPADLASAYDEACRSPDPAEPSLLVQAAVALGTPPALARELRRALAWDAVPLRPYPDAVAALQALRRAGLRVGVLANQPASAAEALDAAGLSGLLSGVWLSEAVGLAKPDPAFFRLALDSWGLAPERVAYVGDRPDNDVAPARALGLYAVRVLLGPHAGQPARGEAQRADHEAASLAAAASHLIEAWQPG